MVYSTNIPNFIESIINLIRDTYSISSITNVGTTYTINTSNTKRLVVGDYVKINSIEYKILTLTINSEFTISSTSAVTGTSWIASAPYFYYGNPIMISNTLDKIRDYQNKFPVIVLFETMPADVDDDENSQVERTVSLQFYFADQANYADWSYEQYYSEVINPLQDYVDEFINALKNHLRIGDLTKHKETPYSKWSLINSETGKNVFNSQLSAIGIAIDLPILKDNC